MEKGGFIKLTDANDNTPLVLAIDSIESIVTSDEAGFTQINCMEHEYAVVETIEQIWEEL